MFREEFILSIIIVNYNSAKVLQDCLRSIIIAELPFKYEVSIVDNASTEVLELDTNGFQNIKLNKNEENIGFAAANNIGIKKAKGKYILLLNPDTIVNENSFQPMIQYLENHDVVGIIGCKIFNAHGEMERSTHSFPTLLKEFVHANEFFKSIIGYNSPAASFLKKIFKTKSLESYWAHNSIKEVDHVTGACMMVKREAIEKVGFLDEAFFLYNEEVEWSYRFKQAGYKSVFLPDSSIIHLFGYSTKQQVQKQTVNDLLVERYRGMFYFFQKHYGPLKLFILRLIVLEGFTIRLINSILTSLFCSKEVKLILKKEREYIYSILALTVKKDFDWRNK